ncbi:MAG TPA: hypothetical protein VJY62_16485 [Bacteroidia bacterium]|nr:hypothetical protein [Bacteroidia bacterium]
MKTFTKISSLLLGIVALIHLLRLITHFQLSIFNAEVPLWLNVAGVLIASALSLGLWKESKA